MNPAEQQIIDEAARLRRENDELRAENERLKATLEEMNHMLGMHDFSAAELAAIEQAESLPVYDGPAEELSEVDEPITEERLKAIGFAIGGLFATKILPSEEGDPVEMFIRHEKDGEWLVSFEQSNELDRILITSRTFRTMDDVRRLISALEG